MTDPKGAHGGGASPNQKFKHFCDPKYSRDAIEVADPPFFRKEFETFRSKMVNTLPDEEPKDGYMYATWMGEFNRQIYIAKDSFVKARLAFFSERGEGKE